MVTPTVLRILTVLAFVATLGIESYAKSAIHEIESIIFLLISAVLLVGFGIVEALRQNQKATEAVVVEMRSGAAASVKVTAGDEKGY